MKDAKDLIEKMVTNQGWNEECLQPKKRGVHTLNEVDMLLKWTSNKKYGRRFQEGTRGHSTLCNGMSRQSRFMVQGVQRR